MTKIRVLIVEDNSMVAEAIVVALKKNQLDPVRICESGEDAIKVFKSEEIDLVLMDIVLAGAMDGISTAQVLREYRPVPVVYLTDHSGRELVERAKKTYPAGYLGKPFNEAELVRTIEIAFNNFQSQRGLPPPLREYVYVRTENQGFVRIAYKEILYLEAARSYCKVVTDTATYLLCSSMNQVQENLSNNDFIRIHRSHVVNSKRVTRLEGNILFIDDKQLDMGREFRDDLLGSLKLIK
ncbi:MAG TPA: response regulator [Cyclobacteriaceae bacterium]|nr:response regulator [Cyclobacteriaceae bacterium]